MKYIIIEDGDIYSVSNEFAQHIKAAFELAESTDGDMSEIIDSVRKYGTFIGTTFLTVRN